MNRSLIAVAFVGALCATASAAAASPIVLEYSGVVSLTDVPGVNPGDPITFKVFADNGGSGLASQSWAYTDVTSATFKAGSYSATTSGTPHSGLTFGGITTDAAGHLLTLFIGVLQNGSDTNGVSTAFAFYMENGNPLWQTYSPSGSIHGENPANTSNVTIALVAATPIPAALPLFASALGGLALLGYRRRASAS